MGNRFGYLNRGKNLGSIPERTRNPGFERHDAGIWLVFDRYETRYARGEHFREKTCADRRSC